MKKIIITGSLGYIGTVLTSYLEERGFECIGYDSGFFEDCVLYPAANAKTVFRDARDLTEKDIKGAEALIHLAGIANDPMRKLDVSKIYDPTREYSLKLAKFCKNQNIKFIYASSCSVYGQGEDSLVNESSEVFPQTFYSKNKVQVEEDLRSIADKDFSPIALRLATVFGSSPRMRFDTVTNMFTGMAITSKVIVMNSDGKAWRPIVHILDVCEAFKRALDIDYKKGELLILNVGDEANNLQIIQLAKIAVGAIPGSELKSLLNNAGLDKEGLIRDRKVKEGVDTRTYSVSFEKIRKVFPGYKAEWTAEKGVREMAALFKKIGLTKETFKKTGFYRLQQLEYLHENKYLSDELRWTKTAPTFS